MFLFLTVTSNPHSSVHVLFLPAIVVWESTAS